jgi:nanoRNase/pAp phosphatase (c-di-AMP/oligoRNAs hydrolase)
VHALRNEETIHAGNRFVVYAMYPQCDISMHVMWGREKQNTVYTVGKSIFGARNGIDIGLLMLGLGGGGHHAAGTCQGANSHAEATTDHLIDRITALSRETKATAAHDVARQTA